MSVAPPPGWETRPTLPPPDRWYGKYWMCERYECVDLALPPHTHDGPDIDRIHVDWRTVAYELTTGHPPLPVGQLTLDDIREDTHSG